MSATSSSRILLTNAAPVGTRAGSREPGAGTGAESREPGADGGNFARRARPARRTRRAFVLNTITVLAAGAALPTSSVGQVRAGDFVRVRLASDTTRWHAGQILSLSATELYLRTGEPRVTFPIADIASLQHRDKDQRGMGTAALLGAAGGLTLGILIPRWAEVPNQDELGYALAATAGGAVLGAAWGSGRTGRKAVLIGTGAGLILGTAIFGNACEQDSPAVICPVFWGGGLGAIFGTVIGAGVGLVLPNWVTVEPTGVRLSF